MSAVYRRALEVVRSRLIDHHQLENEYHHITQRDEAIDFTCTQAELKINKALNRWVNVLPFDYNRVMLSSNGYVNASHISCSLDGFVNASSVSCSLDGSALKAEDTTRYISSQGPLPETIEAFWRLVYEQGCPAIVMLTNLTERGTVKCSEYYPREAGESLQFPSVAVRTVEAHSSPGKEITLRKIEVRSGSSQQEGPLVVTHFHYRNWPDHGVPEKSMAIRSIIKAISKQRERQTRSEARPTVIHCSAGIGRTGSFIAIDMMLQRLERLAGSSDEVDSKEIMRALSLPDLVHDLRRQRMGSVQNLEQYCFIYQALYEELSELCGAK